LSRSYDTVRPVVAAGPHASAFGLAKSGASAIHRFVC